MPIVACFMKVKNMLTTLIIALEVKFVLKTESNAWGIEQILKCLKTEQNTVKPSPSDDYAFKHYLVQLKSVRITIR